MYKDAMLDVEVICAKQCLLNVKVVLSYWMNEMKEYNTGHLQHLLNTHLAKLTSLHFVYTVGESYSTACYVA
jgi:hypothetical protein